MSLLALLLSQATSPTDPPPPTAPPASINMAFAGAETPTLMPQWDHVINVGPTRTYTTVKAAVNAAQRTPYALRGTTAATPLLPKAGRGGRMVHARTLVLLDPGTYTLDAINDTGTGGVDLMGNGDTREDVVIRTNGTTDVRYALRFYGSVYVANLTLKLEPGAAGNNYPMHGSDGGGKHYTAVFDNVHFLESNPTAYGIAGWDMPNGMRAYHYRCRFESTTGHPIIYHDMPGNTEGVHAYFVECAADVDWPTLVTPNVGKPALMVAYDCTTLNGSPRPNVRSVDGGTPGTTATRPDPIVAAITEAEAGKSLPLADAGVLTPAYGQVAMASPVPDRTYYVRLPNEKAALVKSLRLAVQNAGDGVSINLYAGTESHPGVPVQWNRWARATGDVDFTDVNGATTFLERYPERYWLGVRCQAGAVVACSTSVADALYDDGGTDWTGAKLWPTKEAAPVPVGDHVPAAVVVAQ